MRIHRPWRLRSSLHAQTPRVTARARRRSASHLAAVRPDRQYGYCWRCPKMKAVRSCQSVSRAGAAAPHERGETQHASILQRHFGFYDVAALQGARRPSYPWRSWAARRCLDGSTAFRARNSIPFIDQAGDLIQTTALQNALRIARMNGETVQVPGFGECLQLHRLGLSWRRTASPAASASRAARSAAAA